MEEHGSGPPRVYFGPIKKTLFGPINKDKPTEKFTLTQKVVE